jgi:hypothetical protein
VTTSADAIAFVICFDLMKITLFWLCYPIPETESNILKISLSDFSINPNKVCASSLFDL